MRRRDASIFATTAWQLAPVLHPLGRIGGGHDLAMLDALHAGVVLDDAGALVRDLHARTVGRCRRRAATGGPAYRPTARWKLASVPIGAGR